MAREAVQGNSAKVHTPGENGTQLATGQLRGRQSGRVSPRAAIRTPVHEKVLSDHGIMAPGDADRNQHALFDVKPYQESAEDTAKRVGTAPPLPSSRPGFLPGIAAPKRATKADQAVGEARGVPAEDVARRGRKAKFINSYGDLRANQPAPHPGNAAGPVGAAYNNRSDAIAKAPAHVDWYTKQEGGLKAQPGEAISMMDHRATAVGVSLNDMTRASAVTSPRTAWTDSNKMYQTTPNLDAATDTARGVVNATKANGGKEIGDEAREKIGRANAGNALPDRAAIAAHGIGRPEVNTAPIPTGEQYQKVPNFHESLQVGRTDLPDNLRQHFARSHTQDTWDLSISGLGEKTHNQSGSYQIEHMVAGRAALKSGAIPPDAQAATWEAKRNSSSPAPLSASKPNPATGTYTKIHSLFQDNDGKLQPTQFGKASHDDRSDYAKKMGVEF